MKKFAALVLTVGVMSTCAAPASGDLMPRVTNEIYPSSFSPSIMSLLVNKKVKQEALVLEQAVAKSKDYNLGLVESALDELYARVGKTPYVFSGSSVSGWDCSGMVLWFYEKIGISLEHRASLQAKVGEKESRPKLGDIVIFSYKESKNVYHVGIYLEDDVMIHAGGKVGDRTEIISISKFAGSSSKVEYTRLIDTK